MLEYVYLDLAKQNSWKLPVWFYLHHAKKEYPNIRSRAPQNYSEIVTNDSVDKYRTAIRGRSMQEIWEQESDQDKAIRLLGILAYENVNVDDLEQILKDIFIKNPNYISLSKGSTKSNVRKLIRMYDFLKYKK